MAALVQVWRDPAVYGEPHTAEVHPDQLDRWLARGWIQGEAPIMPDPAASPVYQEITGLLNTTWDPAAIRADRAATEGQLAALALGGGQAVDLSAFARTADLAAVAESGSYNDLTDKPSIPAAYDDTALAARVAALESATPPSSVDWQTSGNWMYRVTGDWLEAIYTAVNQTIAVTNQSGSFYRTNAMTLTVPVAIRNNKTLEVKNCSVMCGHSGYPVATTLETIIDNGITWYATSGSSRNSTNGYAITAKIEGALV